LVWVGSGLLLGGAAVHAEQEHLAGVEGSSRLSRKGYGWALLGSGLGLYVASRLLRFGFAVGGVCQDPVCVYGVDQITLGMSRGLMLGGSGLLIHRRTGEKLRLGLGVSAVGWGIAVDGRF
jgi:hypothetical protein